MSEVDGWLILALIAFVLATVGYVAMVVAVTRGDDASVAWLIWLGSWAVVVILFFVYVGTHFPPIYWS